MTELEQQLREKYGSNPSVEFVTDVDGCVGCLAVIVNNVMEVWACPDTRMESGSFNTTLSEAVEAIEARLAA